MKSLTTCSKFQEYPQDNGNTFLTDFESFSTPHGLSELNLTDKRMIAAFNLHLKGPALTWYNSLSNESKSDWKSVRILFKEKYVNFCGHGANALMHNEIFQNLSLSSGQSVEHFYCLIYEEGLFKNKFRDNRRTAADQNTEVRDLQQQIQELIEIVKTQKEMKSDKSSPKAPTAASSEISEMKDQIQTLTEVVESPVEDAPFFPFVEDVCVADVKAVHLTDADTLIGDPYDVDTDESDDNIRKKSKRKMSKQRRTMYKSDTGIADKTLTTSVFENFIHVYRKNKTTATSGYHIDKKYRLSRK
ncbi:Hypothetical predicted protein [Mytilus galloprovincialis]|uniref:Retrotransposon gag domain-containing protein n=1 Tax=Mytilus galloprovincialis TaxID=29158 RepID=A0A8B6BRM5_MYTGA|nr:Hypothetical predicted protein [Mytilus galloprovincialis]